jgi:hypothetical protein
MKMIFKYLLGEDIHHNAVFEIEMPKAAKIMDIQVQSYQGRDRAVIWAIVNPKKETRKYVFHIFGTGFELKEYDKRHYEYVKTVQMGHSSTTAWHIFTVHE